MLKKLSDLNKDNPETVRSGIIPYIVKNGRLFFILGVSIYNDSMITDFGGRIEISNGSREDVVDAAIREYEEECYDVFHLGLTRESLENYDPYVMISGRGLSVDMFIRLDEINIEEVFSRFLIIANDDEKREIKKLICLSHDLIGNERDQTVSRYGDKDRPVGKFDIVFYYRIGTSIARLCSKTWFVDHLSNQEIFTM